MYKVNLAEVMLETTHGGPGHKRALVNKEDVRNPHLMFMNEVYVPPKSVLKLHVHPDLEEIHYFILGTGKMLVGNEYIKVKKGDRIIVPPKSSHCVVNAGNSVMKYICLGIKL
ncbi:MAG: cupin domain-containing protein [Nanoarchaeota archaeon]|nr:cupin domain-containing protein [Nanoarchaeota archaeon]MBU4299950.1 cupin domain-containing protein [Nanoarchaeota archaeon]MBU4452245.1 cupin domain-containing protein [Nanoarchaeota archaeon]MCG2723672.1 cupin domain-containing protein [archaeon]